MCISYLMQNTELYQTIEPKLKSIQNDRIWQHQTLSRILKNQLTYDFYAMFHRGIPDQAQGITGGGSDGQVTGWVWGSGSPQGQGFWLGGQYEFVCGVIFLP